MSAGKKLIICDADLSSAGALVARIQSRDTAAYPLWFLEYFAPLHAAWIECLHRPKRQME